jgi:predicted permease
MFGDCCIPCLLLMLGATLSKGPGQACPPWRVVAAVGAARLVLLPLLGTGWLVLAKTLGEEIQSGGASNTLSARLGLDSCRCSQPGAAPQLAVS